MSCGIYKITNKLNNKAYIGQSIHIEERWKEHIWGKGNQPLHIDIAKYGIENFNFEIIELCSKDQLLEKEKYWIKYFNTYPNGYNLNDGGDNHAFAITKTKKDIYCYDLEGNFLQKYDSLSEAERITGIANSNISRAAKNKGKTLNYQWRYEYQEKILPYKRQNTNVKHTGKLINQYDLNMNYIATFISAGQAEELTGVHHSGINMVCNKKRKTAGGFIWRFKEEMDNGS